MAIENYNEYRESSSESIQSEIDAAINHAKSDLNDLQSEILYLDICFSQKDAILNLNLFPKMILKNAEEIK